jgi:hypothetical protein
MADECPTGDFSPAEDRSAADDHADCKSVRRVLDALGYTEVRPAGSDEWKPLRLADGHFGTTNEMHIVLPAGGRSHAALRDAESGAPVGQARKPSLGGREAVEES